MPKRADPRDVQVGKRVRLYRLKAKLSQEQVGEAVGLTFQQIQKYENGSNRIAPSRLMTMAKLFKVPISTLFGGETDQSQDNNIVDWTVTRSRVEIMSLLDQIDDTQIETRIASLLRAFITRKGK